jgi:hypothetical protein
MTNILFGRNENLVQNQLYALKKLNIYKTNSQNVSHRSSSSAGKREREIKSP